MPELHINICTRYGYIWIFVPETELLVKVNDNLSSFSEQLERTRFVAETLAEGYRAAGYRVAVQMLEETDVDL